MRWEKGSKGVSAQASWQAGHRHMSWLREGSFFSRFLLGLGGSVKGYPRKGTGRKAMPILSFSLPPPGPPAFCLVYFPTLLSEYHEYQVCSKASRNVRDSPGGSSGIPLFCSAKVFCPLRCWGKLVASWHDTSGVASSAWMMLILALLERLGKQHNLSHSFQIFNTDSNCLSPPGSRGLLN